MCVACVDSEELRTRRHAKSSTSAKARRKNKKMVLHLLLEQKNWFVTKMMEPIVELKKSQKQKTKVDIQANKVANFVATTNGSNKVEVVIVIGDDESRLKEKINNTFQS